ncbi:MAG TPA: hypothetical protein VEV44_14150 [Pseudoneobacillus sp.]|nr:hypothetical protein [Pseudoneobacillus sp.]
MNSRVSRPFLETLFIAKEFIDNYIVNDSERIYRNPAPAGKKVLHFFLPSPSSEKLTTIFPWSNNL